ncbi:MAG: serine/threonine protein kinase, partial [Planctomycetes bacterium]|nr:serine/threonine protein kinase [Planctomycetota bacterium]
MKFRHQPETRPLDGYTIKRAIQRGGFGEVYYAHSDAGKEVALKLLNDNTEVELRGVSHCLNLSHPNVMTIFDVRESDGDYWIIMEYVGGKSLDQILADSPNGLPHEQVSKLLAGLSAGVDFLNERGIVHRDLKPANIYTENGHVKVGDVGLSKFISVSRRSAHTQSVGTVYYMAPEIAHGRYGREVDVYAVAVMLFEMLTGKVPFDGETTGEILMKQLSEKPNLSILPAKFRPALKRALEKDPLKRTPTVKKLAEEFEAALAGESQSTAKREQPKYETPHVAASTSSRFESETVEDRGERRTYSHGRPVPSRFDVPWYQTSGGIATGLVLGVVGLFALIVTSPITVPLGVLALPFLGIAAIFAIGFAVIRWIMNAFFLDDGGPAIRYQSRAGTAVRTNSTYVRQISPDASRHVGFLQRTAELTGSMSVAALCGGAISYPFYLSGHFTAPMAVFFGAITTMTAWAAMIPAKLWEGRGGNGTGRRLMTGFLGLAVGVAAFTLDRSMMLDVDVHDYSRVSQHIQNASFIPGGLDSNQAGSLVGYMFFFGVLLLARRWWFHVDSYRPKRVRLLSVAWTSGAALLITTNTQFPHGLAA